VHRSAETQDAGSTPALGVFIKHGPHVIEYNHNIVFTGLHQHNTHHDFSCGKEGLLIRRHNKLCDELCDMASRAFQQSAVSDEPKIHKCRPAQTGQHCTPVAENEDRDHVLIQGLWERGVHCILDIPLTYRDAPTYQMKDPSKVLKAAESLKKKK
jgi:hypothetical protein